MKNNSKSAAAAAHNEELRTARELTHRIAANDPKAEAEAYVRYDKRLRGAVARYARCEADIDDWVSIAWLTALPKLRAGALDKPESLGGFLMSVTRRVAIGELRKCKWLSTSGDTAFLDQAAADAGDVEGGSVQIHPGLNGSEGNPDGTPVNIQGH